MSKLIRALILSAVATGTAALVVNAVRQQRHASTAKIEPEERFVDAEALSDEERRLLSDELGAML